MFVLKSCFLPWKGKQRGRRKMGGRKFEGCDPGYMLPRDTSKPTTSKIQFFGGFTRELDCVYAHPRSRTDWTGAAQRGCEIQ